MSTIELIKVRAKVSVGNSLSVETPYVMSFQISVNRNKTSTFSTSLKVQASSINGTITGDKIQISAGTLGNISLIFSGIIKQANISPCFDDPTFLILSLSGVDVTGILNGKKYTRRSRATRTCWCQIESVNRRGLRSGKFIDQSNPAFGISNDQDIGGIGVLPLSQPTNNNRNDVSNIPSHIPDPLNNPITVIIGKPSPTSG